MSPIKGLTDRGLALPEIGQIRKGAPKSANAPGKDLTYFRVEFDERETKAAETFKAQYGDQPTAIRIILPFNDLTRMWDAWLEAYTAGRMIARSDGEWVHYQINGKTGELLVLNGKDTQTGEPLPHPKDNAAGVDFKGKQVMYKASGRLKVIIPELGRAAYLVVLTTSKLDIANISNQLAAFQQLNNGQIAGIPFILRRRPKKISAPGPNAGQRIRVVKWMLSIEADPDWVKAKLGELNTLALPAGAIHAMSAGVLDEEEYEQVDGELIDDEETDTSPFDVPYPDDEPENEAMPPADPAPAIVYPPELLEFKSGKTGQRYVDAEPAALTEHLRWVERTLKQEKDETKKSELADKRDAIKQILAIKAR